MMDAVKGTLWDKLRCLVLRHVQPADYVDTGILVPAGTRYRVCAGACERCGTTLWWREDA